jgi:hypothetical protein
VFALLFLQRPCVGCGFCCAKAQCPPGRMPRGRHRRCPGLFWDGARYRCRLVMADAQVAAVLRVGQGCCRPLNRWRRNMRERVKPL